MTTRQSDTADISHYEAERLAMLARLQILDTPPEPAFDRLSEALRELLDCKITLLSLVDKDRQWFKTVSGLTATETPRAHAFCAHTIQQQDIMMVPDATLDERFATNPLVTEDPNIRLYAGVPLSVKLGDVGTFPMGTLCAIDDKPRTLSDRDLRTLRHFGAVAQAMLQARLEANVARSIASERNQVITRLNRIHRQLSQAEKMANIGSWRYEIADGTIVWSDQTFHIHGLRPGQQPSITEAIEFYPPHARASISSAFERTLSGGESFDVETDFITAHGELRRVRSIGELEIVDGKPFGVIGVFQDITDRYKFEQRLRKSANTDELTTIANRARFNELFDEAIQSCVGTGAQLALLLVDLDNFKTVNDSFGHLVGDDLLRLMASKLNADYLAGSLVARLGGDEFAILIQEPAIIDNLEVLVSQLLFDMRHTIHHDGLSVDVSATIGGASLDDARQCRRSLFGAADDALYRAKRHRRGSAAFAETSAMIFPAEEPLMQRAAQGR